MVLRGRIADAPKIGVVLEVYKFHTPSDRVCRGASDEIVIALTLANGDRFHRTKDCL